MCEMGDESKVQGPKSKVQGPKSKAQSPPAWQTLRAVSLKHLPSSVCSFLLLAALLCGCVTRPALHLPNGRRFDFQKDTFAFANELRWVYRYDAGGHSTRSEENR